MIEHTDRTDCRRVFESALIERGVNSLEQIGFVGLGIMGRPMAGNLLEKGISLLVYDSDPSRCHLLEAYGAVGVSLQDLAGSCGIIFLMLPDGGVVKEVLFGENGMEEYLSKGALVVDMSSVMPEESRYCEERLRKKHVRFMDSPVSGGEPKAVDKTLAFMAGGKKEDFERVYPYLMKMGASAVLVGEIGSGSTAKLVNQMIVNLTIVSVSEAFVFAAKAGVNPVRVYEAIRGGLAGSAVLDAKIPMILKRDFKPGGKLSINQKDIGNAIMAAHKAASPIPFTSQLYEIMQALGVSGYMDEDHGGLVKYFEGLAGILVKE